MIDKIDLGIRSFKPILPQVEQQGQPKDGQTVADGAHSFGQIFADAIKEANELQKVADDKVQNLTLGKGGVTNHETIIALEKADVAFQIMTRVQSKIIRAYEEIMRTAV